MNAKQKRLTYLCSIIRWLAKESLPIDRFKLAEKCNVNEKTIRRDIDFLCEEGIFEKLYYKKKLFLRETGKYLRFHQKSQPKKLLLAFKEKNTFSVQPVDVVTPSQPVETCQNQDTPIEIFEKAEKQSSIVKEKLINYGVIDFLASKISKSVKIKALKPNFDDIGIILFIYDNYIRLGKDIKNVNGLYRSLKNEGYEISYDIVKKYCGNVHNQQEKMSSKLSTITAENVHDAKYLYNSDSHQNKLVNKQQQAENKQVLTSTFNFLPKDEQESLMQTLFNDDITKKAQLLMQRRKEKALI